MATLKELEASHTMDFKDYLVREWNLNPSYVWIRRSLETPEECLRVQSVNVNFIMVEKGRWMAPIPVHDRRNRRMCLTTKYPDYVNVYLPDGQKFLNVLRNRKETSDIVAWKSSGIKERWTIPNLVEVNKNYIDKQKWKCRYCNFINQGTDTCQGTYYGQLPHGGPPKAQNNVLMEYEYFLSKPTGCPPVLYPFPNEQQLGWHDDAARDRFQTRAGTVSSPCKARRCVHFSHINQSDQILSFPRAQWTQWGKTYVSNTEQFYLPGAMLGHQTTQNECVCPKCRNPFHRSSPVSATKWRTNIEHSWWIIEILYWLKVDVYNKKMQKLNREESEVRYEFLKSEVSKLHACYTSDFVYCLENSSQQTVPFNNILKDMWVWLNDKGKYDARFERKKPPPGFNRNVNLKF
jgi:hypothetical protein